MSVSRDELAKRLKDYGCKFEADIGASRDLWVTAWGQAFAISRARDSQEYSDAECLDIAFFLLNEAPFDWLTRKEFKRVWSAINDLNGQVGRLRGELKRR